MTQPITPSTSNATGSATPAADSSSGSSGGSQAILGQDDFLKLMMVQMQHQDPLQPSDPTQFLSQLAQFTTVEQMTNIATNSAQAAAEQHTVAAMAMIGHTVTYTDSKGSSVTGVVQKVQFTASGPTLTINGVDGIDPASVNEVS